MIILKGVEVSFKGQFVLKHISYQFKDQMFYLIQARNGSGKTTLLNAIVHLVPYRGEIEKTGTANDYFYLPNDFQFDSSMSGRDYLTLFTNLWSSAIDIEMVIKKIKLESFIDKKVVGYSLGMRQLFVLALYIVTDTNCWLIDELNNGLDEENLQLLVDSLLQAKKQNRTILFVTHQIEKIAPVADVTINLNGGNLNESVE
ncbi:hypothetical protein [Lactobacillus pentosus] [Lactiplantibacillus mudanjiangensis]|uniref:ATP-binding cassette domain-containing protein n=1 Tax=Lactiplantibacillus mudanjiangensis TaxID=1296538 RepID=UPI001014F977|nr:ATP-binding cassette domain-containing protein [Lactiplantibacillus mudanjiangensis]VDG18828.1 hypothetical protein [Lactobacillus pentosus] [Lactiplantibacillus mudanjiangensis]VDG32926.1 hypothetical protein [Lactobacillus pentosus] [Lactiplantibacillus mudanjiangensis]